MEKKGDRNSCPKAAFENMYKAARDCPPVRAIRRVSHGVQGASPASPTPSSSPPTPLPTKHHKSMEGGQLYNHNKRENGDAAEGVPIIFDHSSQQPPRVRVAKVSEQNSGQGKKDNPNFQTPHVNKLESKKSGMHIEDRFTDYINRAKIKLRTMSGVGDHKEKSSGKDDKKASGNDRSGNGPVKDRFTEYINRVKINIRRTSSIGVRKYNSSK